MAKLLKRSKDIIVPSAKGEETIEKIMYLERCIDDMTTELNELKKQLKDQMISSDTDTFTYKNYSFTVRKPYERISKKVNYKYLMERGLYDECVKETTIMIDSSLLIKITK